MQRNFSHINLDMIAEAITAKTQHALADNDARMMLREFGIYDWYYSRALFESEVTNNNDWDEVKDLLGQMGRITGTLLKKLTQIGKKKVAQLCVKRGREIFMENKDIAAAIKYTFWSLLFFTIGYTGNMFKERYNEHPIVPGTQIEYNTDENGTDTMTVTNSRGGQFTVQAKGEETPKIVNVKKSDTPVEKMKSDVESSSSSKSNNNNISPIMLLKPGQKHPDFYHGSNEIYKAILFDKLNVNEGMIMENYVAQTLKSKGYELFYYSKNDNDVIENNMEVDFIIVQDKKLNPIEVKSGNYKKHTSIDRFKDKFKKSVGTRYVLHTKDLKVEGDIVYLPLYMAIFL